MSDQLTVELGQLEVFTGLSPAELSDVAGAGTVQDFPAGQVLTEAGRLGTECYVLLDGSAEVTLADGSTVTLGRGDLLGEMAFLDSNRRSADSVAGAGMRALVIHGSEFNRLLGDHPTLMRRVAELLARRVRAIGQSEGG
ncbi:MAG: Crp/Fnr family transcriptional regulator [Candidatus Dormibacteria bacterium]